MYRNNTVGTDALIGISAAHKQNKALLQGTATTIQEMKSSDGREGKRAGGRIKEER